MSGGTEMSEKLPVFATLGEAFRCLRGHWRRILPHVVALVIILLAVVVVAVMMGAGAFLLGKMNNAAMHPTMAFSVVMPVLMLGFGIAIFPVSNSLYRIVVQGEEARFGFGYGREEWMSLWAMLRLWAGMVGIFLLLAIPVGSVMVVIVRTIGENNLTRAIPKLLVIPFFLIMFRLLLVLPAAANGVTLTLRQSFRATKGNSWRLITVVFLGSIPFSIVQKLLPLILGTGIVVVFLVAALSLLSWIFNAIVIGLVYKHFSSQPKEPQTELEPDAIPDPVI